MGPVSSLVTLIGLLTILILLVSGLAYKSLSDMVLNTHHQMMESVAGELAEALRLDLILDRQDKALNVMRATATRYKLAQVDVSDDHSIILSTATGPLPSCDHVSAKIDSGLDKTQWRLDVYYSTEEDRHKVAAASHGLLIAALISIGIMALVSFAHHRMEERVIDSLVRGLAGLIPEDKSVPFHIRRLIEKRIGRRRSEELDAYLKRQQQQFIQTTEKKVRDKSAEQAMQNLLGFFARLAHDQRTPAGHIRMLVSAVRAAVRRKDCSAAMAAAEQLSSAEEHLSSLFEEILDMARIAKGAGLPDPARIDVIEVIDSEIERHYPLASHRGIQISLKVSSKVPSTVVCSEPAIRQAMRNLLSNAIKYNDKTDGRIMVTVRWDANMNLSIDVIDNGRGISADDQANLFTPFHDTESTQQGLGKGMGLFTVAETIGSAGGSILLVSSSPAYGSRFRLTIPANDPLYSRSECKTPFNQVWILTERGAHMQATLLRRYCAHVVAFSSAHDLLAYIETHHEPGSKALLLVSGVLLATEIQSHDLKCVYPVVIGAFSAKPVNGFWRDHWPYFSLGILHSFGVKNRLVAQRKHPMGRILVVDDDPLNLSLLPGFLEREAGIDHNEVDTAQSFDEALANLYMRRYGIVITDHHMPGKTGLDLAREIKRTFPRPIEIVVLTASATETLRREYRAAGATLFISKPPTRSQLDNLSALFVEKPSEHQQNHNPTDSPDALSLQFAERVTQWVDDIRNAPDAQRIREIAHQAKGTSAIFGFGDLSTLFATIEKDPGSTDLPGLLERIEQLNND